MRKIWELIVLKNFVYIIRFFKNVYYYIKVVLVDFECFIICRVWFFLSFMKMIIVWSVMLCEWYDSVVDDVE